MKYNFEEMETNSKELLSREEKLLAFKGEGVPLAWESPENVLTGSFIWAATPQGHAFWVKHYQHGTEEGREALAEMIAQAKEESAQ